MIYVDCCRLCKTGPIGLRRCGSCGAISAVCDECDALWTSADFAAPPVLEDSEVLPCPACGAGLWDEGSTWATEDQAKAEPWVAKAVSEGKLQLKRSEN